MGKYKNYDNACANPFLIHKKAIIVGLRSFTSEMKSKFDTTEMDHLEEEKYICTNCFRKISKLQPTRTLEKEKSMKSSSSSSSSSSLEDTVQVGEEYSCTDETNKTLKSLFVSPIKTRKKYFQITVLTVHVLK